MRAARWITVLVAFPAWSSGCASRGGAALRLQSPGSESSGIAVVTAQELGRLARQSSILEALQQLRPSILAPRGMTPPLVSIDGSPPAELWILRTIQASSVREVRLNRASAATGRPSIGPDARVTLGDVITVTTSQGPRNRR